MPRKNQNLHTESGHDQVAAVVVGLCAHGLDVIRALTAYGITVHALESDRALPGARTRMAHKHFVDELSGVVLVDSLIEVRNRIGSSENPVLYLMNDSMVFAVHDHLERLSKLYRISWANSGQECRDLLNKSNLEEHCAKTRVPYPSSHILHGIDEVADLRGRVEFPIIAKPVLPRSSFKVQIVDLETGLRKLLLEHPTALPVVVQKWIPGDAARQLFCAVYFRQGEPLIRFEGRKLHVVPALIGTTCATEQATNDALYEQTIRFFADLDISGPVSLEVKQATDGTMWTIEPTLFRTDWWLGCCVANGVNLPIIEYCDQVGIKKPRIEQRRKAIWMDIEPDPLWIIAAIARNARRGRILGGLVLTFVHWRDPLPLLHVVASHFKRAILKLGRVIRSGIGRQTDLGP